MAAHQVPIPGILQARILEWVVISFSSAWKWKKSEVAQSCPTLSNPMDCSLPGSSVHGIFQGRVLEWVAIAFPIAYRWVASDNKATSSGRFYTGKWVDVLQLYIWLQVSSKSPTLILVHTWPIDYFNYHFCPRLFSTLLTCLSHSFGELTS